MPVFVGIRESGADELILVHSNETKSVANLIAKYAAEFTGIEIRMLEIPAVDYNTAKRTLDNELKCYADEEVTVNISGGSKPWSIAVALLSSKYKNVTLIYIDQNCRIYNLSKEESQMVQPFDGGIRQILDYNMNSTESHIELTSYTEQDLNIIEDIKRVRRSCLKTFNSLTIPSKANKSRFQNNLADTIEDLATGSTIEWNRRDPDMQYVKLYLTDSPYIEGNEYDFSSPHAFDLITSSGWFEYEVATILNGWDKTKEIWMNVVFPYNNKLPKNEIDIIVNVGYKLLFVECKTKIFDNTDIDKFASAVKAYGGMGSKAVFISMEPMSALTLEKCQTNNIASYSMYRTIESRYGKKRRVPNEREKLYELLNSIMPNTNTR